MPAQSPPQTSSVNPATPQQYDPTANVIALNEASVKRTDDMAGLREQMFDQQIQHVKEMAEVRDKHYQELNAKESSRLDSIRQVDVQNQALAAKAALDAIQALAATTTVNADNIRNALNATAASNAKATTDLAATIAAQQAATADALSIRIAALEKANAEGVGKGRVVDPQIEALLTKVDSLAASRNVQTGSDPALAETLQTILKTQSATAQDIQSLRDTRSTQAGASGQSGAIWGFIVGGVGLAVSVILLIIRLLGR